MGIDGGRIWSGYGPDESLQDVESKCFYAFHTGVAFGTERDILTVFLLLILTRVILGGSWGARSLSGGRWLRWVHDVDGGGSGSWSAVPVVGTFDPSSQTVHSCKTDHLQLMYFA